MPLTDDGNATAGKPSASSSSSSAPNKNKDTNTTTRTSRGASCTPVRDPGRPAGVQTFDTSNECHLNPPMGDNDTSAAVDRSSHPPVVADDNTTSSPARKKQYRPTRTVSELETCNNKANSSQTNTSNNTQNTPPTTLTAFSQELRDSAVAFVRQQAKELPGKMEHLRKLGSFIDIPSVSGITRQPERPDAAEVNPPVSTPVVKSTAATAPLGTSPSTQPKEAADTSKGIQEQSPTTPKATRQTDIGDFFPNRRSSTPAAAVVNTNRRPPTTPTTTPVAAGVGRTSTQGNLLPTSPAGVTPRTVVGSGRAPNNTTPTRTGAASTLITPEDDADLPEYTLTESDKLLDTVYGDHLHDNDGTHLDGGTGSTDRVFQGYWKKVVGIHLSLYDVPKCRIGKRFLGTLIKLLQSVRVDRTCNFEQVVVFIAVILQRRRGVSKASDIKRRLECRMNLWEQGKYRDLVQDIVAAASGPKANSTKSPAEEENQMARRFNSKVLSGRIRQAVRGVTQRNGGGVYDPLDKCSKTGQSVIQVLQQKHPAMREPLRVGTDSFEPYDEEPYTMVVDITDQLIERVALRLHGAAGPSGVDAITLQGWLLRYGKESSALREEMAKWANWLANGSPPWAAYRALVAARLVALDKEPGVRPLGIGESFFRLIAKTLVLACGDEATKACSSLNLCAGLKAGIEGAVHALVDKWTEDTAAGNRSTPHNGSTPPSTPPGKLLTQPGESVDQLSGSGPRLPPADLDQRRVPRLGGSTTEMATDDAQPEADGASDAESLLAPTEDPHVILLVDADNGFNELNRKAAMWTLRHLWPSGCRFVFNSYRHSRTLILRRRHTPCCYTLQSREGVTQGDPTSMITYGLALCPMSEQLWASFPDVLQPMYADDLALEGRSSSIAAVMTRLQELGPARGYYPSPEKSILISLSDDKPAAEAQLWEHNFVYKTGSRYLGSFVGDKRLQDDWVEAKIDTFVASVETLSRVARRYPQTAYAAMTRSLQMEWQYLLRVLPGIDSQMERLEQAIERDFIPAIFASDDESLTEEFRSLTALSVRHGGVGLPNPSEMANDMHEASRNITMPLVEKLREIQPLDVESYVRHAAAEARESRAQRDLKQDQTFKDLRNQVAAKHTRRQMDRSRQTGGWLTAYPSSWNDTELSKDEFRDNIRLRYGLPPTNLPTTCDGCGKDFDVGHALSCAHGGMIHRRHDDVAFEWASICRQATIPSAVTSEPFIYTGRTAKGIAPVDKDGFPLGSPDDRGDVAVHNFWQRGFTCIFDVRVTDTDQFSYRKSPPETVLQRQEDGKKRKYLEACLDRRRHFTPLIFSVDGMRGKEATAATKQVAKLLSSKWSRGYNQCIQFVRSRLSIALARNVTMCLRGPRDHGPRRSPYYWGEGDGGLLLHLM